MRRDPGAPPARGQRDGGRCRAHGLLLELVVGDGVPRHRLGAPARGQYVEALGAPGHPRRLRHGRGRSGGLLVLRPGDPGPSERDQAGKEGHGAPPGVLAHRGRRTQPLPPLDAVLHLLRPVQVRQVRLRACGLHRGPAELHPHRAGRRLHVPAALPDASHRLPDHHPARDRQARAGQDGVRPLQHLQRPRHLRRGHGLHLLRQLREPAGERLDADGGVPLLPPALLHELPHTLAHRHHVRGARGRRRARGLAPQDRRRALPGLQEDHREERQRHVQPHEPQGHGRHPMRAGPLRLLLLLRHGNPAPVPARRGGEPRREPLPRRRLPGLPRGAAGPARDGTEQGRAAAAAAREPPAPARSQWPPGAAHRAARDR
mmetsp:Transcript_34314/g.108164  ORF Transcript_34314/g.108164 Transcript_34314/m.108164 type:complete len:374 (+) Transcript_34314:2031-3152(+)